METNNQSQKKISLPTVHFLDCTENTKLAVSRSAQLVIVEAIDKKGHTNGFVAFRLKKPYARNYRKLSQALLSVGHLMEEQIEIKKA